ncbi:16S rRNA (cytosine(1402)-N(4))-methyltransferase RsmH [Nitrococcus mobilis]|uniref:16S rRNA (cytosine(1402)-N(4))-methyltransferase RsmH n=1 Tax=Nitrococcus mobilis TaxID=35797 RepID=UPI0002E25A38|nr:16S rRNA (cytosine(1402)-N(4))-methyltransferase RsmH [Nitrococcus mobilis]
MNCLRSSKRFHYDAQNHRGPHHRPVLLEAAIDALRIQANGVYVDGTFGCGGHAAAILKRLATGGRLGLIDKDPSAISRAQQKFAADARCFIHHGSYAELGVLADTCGVRGRIDGVLLDLGASSPQLDEARRGFSFLRDGPLDMRMDPSKGVSAAAWLADTPLSEIESVIRRYGEERYARRIAQAIDASRQAGRLPQTTGALAALIAAAVPRREVGKHPATRSFQAIRIAINDELEELRCFLAGICDLLCPGGRLVVISFHSLEDRLVKRFMRDHSRIGDLPPGIPIVAHSMRPRLRRPAKPVRPGAEEIRVNPRARSAVLRVTERLP